MHNVLCKVSFVCRSIQSLRYRPWSPASQNGSFLRECLWMSMGDNIILWDLSKPRDKYIFYLKNAKQSDGSLTQGLLILNKLLPRLHSVPESAKVSWWNIHTYLRQPISHRLDVFCLQDSSIAYKRAVLNCIDYLHKFGYTKQQVSVLLVDGPAALFL